MVRPDAHLLHERPFAPLLTPSAASPRGTLGSDWVATPSGFVNVRDLEQSPRWFRAALDIEGIREENVVLLHFDDLPMEEIRKVIRMHGVTPLGEAPNNAFMVTGAGKSTVAELIRAGVTVRAWAPGFFVSPDIGRNPLPDPDMAADPVLHLYASVFPGIEPDGVADRLVELGAGIEGGFNGLIAFSMHIDRLREILDLLTGLPIRALAERGYVTSAGEEASTGIQTGEFRRGTRPYTEAGVDGSSQTVAMTDTGLSLDATVLSHGTPGVPGSAIAGAAGLGHRKVVAYVRAQDLPGNPGTGDLLTCDGMRSGTATHGHLVASVATGNASELLADIHLLPGFGGHENAPATAHAVDGVASQARVYFVDAQVDAQCFSPEQIEAQAPGILSANVAGAKTFGIANGLDLKIHNFSFSILGSQASYTVEAQDLDTFLKSNQDFLVVTAAGNRGTDIAPLDGMPDFDTVTAPGTAKNVLTVGSSGAPNEPLDPGASVVPHIPNRGMEMMPWTGVRPPSMGPAARTLHGGFDDWRIKPDVMAPGGETQGNQRLVEPATCVSSDPDQTDPVECLPMTPGILSGTSFAAAAASGAAALVRDYFAKGYAPAGQPGWAPHDLTGPELKAALIASAELMRGNDAWDASRGSTLAGLSFPPHGWGRPGAPFPPGYFSPRHLSRLTPEQGYGRIQLDRLLPLTGEPGTPSFVTAETVTLPLAVPTSFQMTLIDAGEELRCAVSWYDKEASVAGVAAQGNLVRDVDLSVIDCGPDLACGNSDDTTYHGNFFSEDKDFNLSLGGAEDCNGNGLLDFSEFSLPVTGTACGTAARDRNNNNEAVFLAPDQLTAGHTMRLDLTWVSTSEAVPPGSIDAGLVCTGGLESLIGSANRIRANQAEFDCNDALEVTILDGGQNASPASVSAGVTITSRDGLGVLLDTESLPLFVEDIPGTRFSSSPMGVVEKSLIPQLDDDQTLSVEDGGWIEIRYSDPPEVDALAEADVRCAPAVGLMNIVRRGRDAGFGLTGGCDPRPRFDPRAVLFGLVPGLGLNTMGDLFMDRGESLVYSVAFVNQEETPLIDVEVSLTACVAGTAPPSGSCTQSPAVAIYDREQEIGTLPAGRHQTAAFSLRVHQSAGFPDQIQMLFEVSAQKNGRPWRSEFVFHHVLDVDEDAVRYSTDFPQGGQEIRLLAAEAYWLNPTDPYLQAEQFDFGNATTAAFGGGNGTLLGFNPVTGEFDQAIDNTNPGNAGAWPWTFDLDDEGWGQRRRFDSDPGTNLDLASENVWQWNNTGECGFQSNDPSQIDGPGGTGGIWHTGFAHTMAGTPGGRVGWDPPAPLPGQRACEKYDLPLAVNATREFVLDAVSSPVFSRVHQDTDADGFAYTLEFLRLGINIQSDLDDSNVIMGLELDPDVTSSEPVDPLDFGWLASDQGPAGFLSVGVVPPPPMFDGNNPHLDSATFRCVGGSSDGMPCTGPGDPGCGGFPCVPYMIGATHGAGSPDPFAGPFPPRAGFTTAERRDRAGLPLRNYDFGLGEMWATSFEDIFGPNETPDPGQTYPISVGNPEILLDRRDAFQVNVIALLQEREGQVGPSFGSYGWGIDDVVVEWREVHPTHDTTPCSNPYSWAVDANRNPVGAVSAAPTIVSGCASIFWDRRTIHEPETTLTLTVIDTDAQFGPSGIVNGDEQAVDTDGDGFTELYVPVNSDVDLVGETFRLDQIELASPVYQGQVKVSTSHGLMSGTDGVIFIQESGNGTTPVALNAYYTDQDINLLGTFAAYVPCPDNPLIATAMTRFTAADVRLVSVTVTEETVPPAGLNSDFDGIADPFETIMLDVAVINTVVDGSGGKPDLHDVTIHLMTEPQHLGPDKPVACLIDGSSFFGDLPSGTARFNEPGDPFLFVVGDVERMSTSEVNQAEFTLGIQGWYLDGEGNRRTFSTFTTPQRFALDLDLDIDPNFPAYPVVSDQACAGGANSGKACATVAECPGLKANGTPATCDPLPLSLQTGGTSLLAGQVGYYESFEGAVNMGGRNFTGPWPQAIPGTRFVHTPAVHASGGYLDGNLGVSYLPGPLTPGAVLGNGPDDPLAPTAVDGLRCQYSDPWGPTKHHRSASLCRPWDGSDWHANAAKAFTGAMSLYYGVDGVADLVQTADWDTYHTGSLAAAFSDSVFVGMGGGATLSLQHIVQTADDRAFDLPAGQAADRVYVMAAETDPVSGGPMSAWTRIEAFQNHYSSQALEPGYANCVFQSYDAHYEAASALGHTPGWNPAATNMVGVFYNADGVSSEDDYFDPNDPLRLLGPSESCFPQFAFSSVGDYTSIDPTDAGRAFTDGATGAIGTGVWVNSLFNLDRFAGRSIRLRFVFSGMEVTNGATWVDILGPDTTNATRGWRIDDVAISGLVDAPVVLVPDMRGPLTSVCPVDPDPMTPDNEAACNVVMAEAGPSLVMLAPGELVSLDASVCVADSCVDGFLEYRWRIGGTVLRDWSTNPLLHVAPLVTTVYTLDVRCSTDRECADTDTVAVVPAQDLEVSGLPGFLGAVVPGGGPPAMQQALTTWWKPSVSIPVTIDVLGLDILHNSNELRDLGGTPPTAANLAERLRSHLCHLGGATPLGDQVQFLDALYLLNSGEIVGYLAVAESTDTGVFGTLGQGEEVGTVANGFSRGRQKASLLPACTP